MSRTQEVAQRIWRPVNHVEGRLAAMMLVFAHRPAALNARLVGQVARLTHLTNCGALAAGHHALSCALMLPDRVPANGAVVAGLVRAGLRLDDRLFAHRPD
jgi:hypothetical protein